VIARFGLRLDFGGRILLGAAAALAVAAPNVPGQESLPVHVQTQDGTAKVPQFDVASIRENIKSVDGRTHIYRHPDDGQFVAINAPLRMLLQFAFDMPDAQILNAPEWARSRNFDVEAKADSAVDDWMRKQDGEHAKLAKQKMLQALLAERFALLAHQENRDLPVYALVVDKRGSKLQEAKGGAKFDGGRTQIVDQGVTVAVLADQLARVVGRPVVDRTAIAGQFDVKLQWAADDRPAAASDAGEAGPSIFTAVQEQLGLKLEPAKAPVPVLVIDHVEMPSAN
jgi:uncharacterized protein (TIGR03435 family)